MSGDIPCISAAVKTDNPIRPSVQLNRLEGGSISTVKT
jgi:hypothetical protein